MGQPWKGKQRTFRERPPSHFFHEKTTFGDVILQYIENSPAGFLLLLLLQQEGRQAPGVLPGEGGRDLHCITTGTGTSPESGADIRKSRPEVCPE